MEQSPPAKRAKLAPQLSTLPKRPVSVGRRDSYMLSTAPEAPMSATQRSVLGYRFPQTRNSRDFWFVPFGKWDRAVGEVNSTDEETAKAAAIWLRKVVYVGKLMETDEGVDAERPCSECDRLNLPCRIPKGSSSNPCAYCYLKDGGMCEHSTHARLPTPPTAQDNKVCAESTEPAGDPIAIQVWKDRLAAQMMKDLEDKNLALVQRNAYLEAQDIMRETRVKELRDDYMEHRNHLKASFDDFSEKMLRHSSALFSVLDAKFALHAAEVAREGDGRK